jgi:hypothetical protein
MLVSRRNFPACLNSCPMLTSLLALHLQSCCRLPFLAQQQLHAKAIRAPVMLPHNLSQGQRRQVAGGQRGAGAARSASTDASAEQAALTRGWVLSKGPARLAGGIALATPLTASATAAPARLRARVSTLPTPLTRPLPPPPARCLQQGRAWCPPGGPPPPCCRRLCSPRTLPPQPEGEDTVEVAAWTHP